MTTGIILDKVKKLAVSGKGKNGGLIFKLVIYAVLLGIGFAYVYPVLYMLVNSFMDTADLINPTVDWVPTQFYTGNYTKAFNVLAYFSTLIATVSYVVLPTITQTMTAALAGYAFGRFEFPLKNFWFVMALAAFLVPTPVMLVPKYLLYNSYGLIGNPLIIHLPAILGQGIKSTIFIFIFFSYFKTYPKSLDEAAEIDGASRARIFFRIALPMAVPTIVVSILFSFVWYWNETSQLSMYVGNAITTLPLRLQGFVAEFTKMYPASEGSEANRINESIRMAGTILTITPLVVLYLILQKFFVEGIESAGITGE